MGQHQLAGLSSSKASLPCPCGGHATTEQALHKDRQQAKRCPDAPPERSDGSSGMKQALGQPTQERHEGERESQVGCHHSGGQQLGHRQRTQTSLHRHQNHQTNGQPGQPSRQLAPLKRRRHSHHHQGNADDEGIKAVKPLKEHLNIHLATRQKRAEAQGPVRAGQAGFHHPGCSTDHHQSDHGNH